jgi:hypothetical protein
VAYPAAFPTVEEEHLIGFGNGLVPAEMTDVNTAIGKNQVRGASILFGALVPVLAATGDVHECGGRSLEEQLGCELRHGCIRKVPT